MANWTSNGIVDSRYKFSLTVDSASTSSVILETENKFVDKNILVQANVQAGALAKQAGAVAISVQNATILGNSANSAPSSGPYIQITGSGTVKVGTAGWLAANTSLSSNEAKIYYPIKVATFAMDGANIYCNSGGYVPTGSTTQVIGTITAATVTTTLGTGNMSTYFNSGSSSDNNVTLTPYYTNSAGYLAAHASNTNAGNISYWKIKTTAVTVTSTVVSNGAISRQAGVTWGTGWVSTGSITAAVFGSAVASGKTEASYVDISGTNAAPVLVSGSYLYINEGYTSNIKISLARLVPDSANISIVSNTSADILQGKTAYDNTGKLITGTIPSIAATQYTPGKVDQVIAAGNYLAGAQTIVGDNNLDVSNIKYGITIFGVTGTFTQTPSGKTALAAAALRSGYTGFINGTRVDGTMPNATFSSSASSLTATTNNTAQSSTTPTLPFSIYTSSDTHGILITTTTTTAAMGENKVFIRLDSSGSVKCTSDPGGYVAKNAGGSITSLTRYIAMSYYTGTYSIP